MPRRIPAHKRHLPPCQRKFCWMGAFLSGRFAILRVGELLSKLILTHLTAGDPYAGLVNRCAGMPRANDDVHRRSDNSRSACVLKPHCLNGTAEIEPLKQELEKIQALRHSNIASGGTIEETEDHHFFIHREFLDGVTLEEVIWKQAPLPLSRTCAIAKQIARALESAHHAGIIHGNLTPSQVLLVSEENEERIKVLGFGTLILKKDRFINLARLALRDGGALLFGDPEYISPEQAVGMAVDALDGRSDLYSLGVILYQMLTGDLPIQRSNAMETVLGHVFSEPRPLGDRRELEIPEVIDTLVRRLLAKIGR